MKDNIITNIDLEKENQENYNYFKEIKEKLDKDGESEFNFKNGKVFILGDNFVYKLNDGTKIYFFKNSRILYFSNKKLKIKNKPYFIHNKQSYEEALKKTNITNGVLKDEEEEVEDKVEEEEDDKSNKQKNKKNSESEKSGSSSSSIKSLDIKDILKTSYNYIEEDNSIKVNKIFTEGNFKEKFNFDKISNLDFNFKYLKEDYLKNSLEFIKEQNNWYRKLDDIYSNKERSYCFLFGPKGVGKTTLLLKYLNGEEIPRLYFSLKIMSKIKNNNNKKWKKISFYETLYTFTEIDEMKNFSENKIKDISDSENLMEFIFSYIKTIFNFYSENNSKKRLFVVIDDYNQDLYDKDNIIDQIINYVQSHKHVLFLCILGEGQYINKKLYLYLTNKNQDFSGAYWSFLIDNDLTKENTLLKLPKYYFKYRDLIKKANVDDMVEQSIINEFKKFSLNSFFMLSKYINISINIEEIKDEFINIPFEYMEIEQKKDINNKMLIKFNFTLEIYKKVFEDSIKGLLKIDNLMTKMDLFGEEDTGKNGIEFEDLCRAIME